jgi:hypothetical protein
MQPARFITMLGVLATGHALAADLSVGIVGLGSGLYGGGTAISLYSTSKIGINLLETYVLDQTDFTGRLATPLLLAVNPAHDFVYVAYTGKSLPIIAGYSISTLGLTLEWEQELSTGDSSLQGSTITAGPDYLIEYTYPAEPDELFLYVIDQATGNQILNDVEPGAHGIWLITGRVDSSRTYYYSCRSNSSSPPAKSVTVFAIEPGRAVDARSAKPIARSADPTYVQSVCD